MVRGRFHALAPERREAILGAALDEFSQFGYQDASLNRIIAAAGVSKGSIYYYFDDKDDLYAHLIRVQVENLIDRAGPFPVPPAGDPDAYWSIVESYCERLVRCLDADSRIAALLRGWLAVAATPALKKAQEDAERGSLAWFASAITAGQSAGAVRTDVPDALLLSVVTALGRVIDLWAIEPRPPSSRERFAEVRVLVGMIRRAVEP